MPTDHRIELLRRCSFPPGHLQLAVSGGADSLALLALAAATGQPVTAHHVDHGLRAGSELEPELVATAAQRFGAGFVPHGVSIDDGPNLEARARAARYAALPDEVLTGHTADDQAETILINVLRGAALDGLAGMSATKRPLIKLRRQETHQLCQELELTPVVDLTNNDPRFLRNRLRHEALPLLADIAGRDLVPLMTRQSELLREETQYLEACASSLDVTDAKALSGASPVLARRAVRRWLRQHLDAEHHPPDQAAVERVLAVSRGESTACDVAGGWEVRRSAQRLHLQPKKT